MAKKPTRKRLSKEELDTLVDESDDIFRLAIQGFTSLESLLEEGIADHLASNHSIELHNLPFRFKLDLAIALGVVPVQAAPTFKYLATVRNQFAHGQREIFSKRDAKSLQSLWTEDFHKVWEALQEDSEDRAKIATPHWVLGGTIMLITIRLEEEITQYRDSIEHLRLSKEELRKVVSRSKERRPSTEPRRPIPPSERQLRIEAEVTRLREERKAIGEL